MVGTVTFKIEGGKELADTLKTLGPRVAVRGGDQALRAGAKPILKEAKRLVPVRTGRLRRSIVARRGKAEIDTRSIYIGVKPPGRRYAHLVEFGTRHSAAHPFLRPALDVRARDAFQAMTNALATFILRQEWRRAIGLLASGVDLDFGDGDGE